MSLNAEENTLFIPSADNVSLFCRTIGQGNPIIVIHGGPGLSQDYLLPQMYELAKNHFVIFYDQRGCGQSTGEINSETINIKAFVKDIESIRNLFKYDKVSILGHSWGGFLAMQYAIAHSEHIDKLILSNPMPASAYGFAEFLQEWLNRMIPHLEKQNEIQQQKGYEEKRPDLIEQNYRLIFRTYCYDPEKAEQLNVHLPASALTNGEKVYVLLNEGVFKKPFDLYPQLVALKMPVLIIHGDVDPVPLETAEKIHETIPHSQFLVVEKCGHFPFIEQPTLYFKTIEQFLKGKSIL